MWLWAAFEGRNRLHVVFGSLKMVLRLRLLGFVWLLFVVGLAGVCFAVARFDENVIHLKILNVQHLSLLFDSIQSKHKMRPLRVLDLNRSLALLALLEVALLVLDDALDLLEPLLDLPVLGYGLQYVGNAVGVVQGRAVSRLVGIVVGVLATLLDLQLVVLQEFSVIFESVGVLDFLLGLMLVKAFAGLTLISFAVFVDLVAVPIVLQYSDLLVLSFLGPREVLVVHEFALAVDRAVFERLALLAVLAALLLRVLMLPAVDLLERSAVLFNFFEDIRRSHADLGLSLRGFAEEHLEIFFHVDGVVVKDAILG